MRAGPIIQVRDARDLADVIAAANADAENLELQAGGSKSDIGYREEASRRVDVSALSNIVAYEPSELVLTAQPGARLTGIEDLLAAEGQMLAFEPMDHGQINGTRPGQATLGGILAANASGPRRLSAGAARDHFLGFHAISGRGEPFKSGGRVVKNVTGFDLPKLMAGSWGSLAAFTEVTVKVMPKPDYAVTLVILGQSGNDGAVSMSRAMGSPADVSGAAYFPSGIATLLPALAGARIPMTALRLEGFEPSVAARETMLRPLYAKSEIVLLDPENTRLFWVGVRDVACFADGDLPLWCFSAPPMNGHVIAEQLRDLAPDWYSDWAGGRVWLALSDGSANDAHAARIHEVAKKCQGHATLVRAPHGAHKAAIDISAPSGPVALLSRRIKDAFDPRHVLNPGRMAVK
jgi:glycolate oxidase FAD binding subunit